MRDRDEAAFLRSIAEEGDNNTGRLVFADWLEEHGESPRAEFIRVQCELTRLRDEDCEAQALAERLPDTPRDHASTVDWSSVNPALARRERFPCIGCGTGAPIPIIAIRRIRSRRLRCSRKGISPKVMVPTR